MAERRQALDEVAVRSRLEGMTGWSLVEGKLQKRFRFKRFVQSIAFVNQLAAAAEEMDHHPDIFISFNQVTLYLMTHSAGGITDRDFFLAAKADELAPGVMAG